MKKFLPLLWSLCFAAFPPGLPAQEAPQTEDYNTLLQQAIKSGRLSQSASGDWDARVKKISGVVRVRASDGDDWSVLADEMPLELADSIKTSDGVAEVYLDDGGVITVGRNTELEISSLGKDESLFTLKSGNIAAKIRHFLDEKLKMQVRTPSAVCAVRGTEFAVEYSQLGKDTAVAVFDEGRVAVSPQAENGQPQGEYLLEKNTELVLAQSQKRFRAVPLSRMSRYRTVIIAMRARLGVLKKTWKPAGAARKTALRDAVFRRKGGSRIEPDKPARAVKKGKPGRRVKKPFKNRVKRKAQMPALLHDK
ncbi:MAG: FecR family protein [Elusimicrobiales bacterium]|jgi:hypothetical protein